MTINKYTAIIDYGAGNILSVSRAVEKCGADYVITSNQKEIDRAERIILPGVGAFGAAMSTLVQLPLVGSLIISAKSGTPFLGICLGMQMLLSESEEFGQHRGLELIPGKVVSIPKTSTDGILLKIPQIGWNEIYLSNNFSKSDNLIVQDHNVDDALYFVHSFMANPRNPSEEIAFCNYGGYKIPAIIGNGNIIGCQFHPEKSGKAGLKILHRFLTL